MLDKEKEKQFTIEGRKIIKKKRADLFNLYQSFKNLMVRGILGVGVPMSRDFRGEFSMLLRSVTLRMY